MKVSLVVASLLLGSTQAAFVTTGGYAPEGTPCSADQFSGDWEYKAKGVDAVLITGASCVKLSDYPPYVGEGADAPQPAGAGGDDTMYCTTTDYRGDPSNLPRYRPDNADPTFQKEWGYCKEVSDPPTEAPYVPPANITDGGYESGKYCVGPTWAYSKSGSVTIVDQYGYETALQAPNKPTSNGFTQPTPPNNKDYWCLTRCEGNCNSENSHCNAGSDYSMMYEGNVICVYKFGDNGIKKQWGYVTDMVEGDTNAPQASPTNAPQVQPTGAPVTPATDAPQVQPTGSPVTPSTGAPVTPSTPSTDAPQVQPTDAPQVNPTGAPVGSTTSAPQVNPTGAPVGSTTSAPVARTLSPGPAKTSSPTEGAASSITTTFMTFAITIFAIAYLQ